MNFQVIGEEIRTPEDYRDPYRESMGQFLNESIREMGLAIAGISIRLESLSDVKRSICVKKI